MLRHASRFRFLFVSLSIAALAFGAACGGGDDDDSDGGDDSGSTPEASTATAQSGNNQNGGSSNVDADDMESFASDLEPDGGKEAMRFAADGGYSIAWETSKSLDDLKDFYDDRLDDLDLNVQGKLDFADSHTWIIGRADGKGIQGTVTVTKSSDTGSLVSVALTKES